jgi:hypothetical protein
MPHNAPPVLRRFCCKCINVCLAHRGGSGQAAELVTPVKERIIWSTSMEQREAEQLLESCSNDMPESNQEGSD